MWCFCDGYFVSVFLVLERERFVVNGRGDGGGGGGGSIIYYCCCGY